MAPSLGIIGRLIGIAPDRGTRPNIRVQGLKCRLAGFCLLVIALLPLNAAAQITGPLVPYVVRPPTIPRLLPSPGAQEPYAGETVLTRPRPEFDPIGLRLGDFFWFPRAELGEAHNNNIFASSTAPTSDLITVLQPRFDLLSIFPQHAFNLHGSSVSQFYADNSAQNTQDGNVKMDGRLDVTAGSSFFGTASVAHRHISYGSPNSPGNIAQPVTYWDYIATAGYIQARRRFSYQVDAGVEAAQYNPVPLVGGGISQQSTQNALIPSAAVRASYELVPDYLGYIRVGSSFYNYWHAVGKNSSVYRINLGLEIRPRHLIYGEAYLGYLVQNYGQQALGSTAAPDYGGRLVWNITPLATLTFTGLRAFYTGTPTARATTVPGPAGNGYLSSTIDVNADYELLRNLLLNLNAGYENDSFQGITRTDNVFTIGAGAKYLVNRNLFLGSSISYYQRNSTVSTASFNENVLMLRVGTQF